MKMGFTNVKTVSGLGKVSGGEAMEKYFEHYHAFYGGGRIINPITGKVIVLRKGK